MVGLKGPGPYGVVQTIRVKAINPHYGGLILREFDVLIRADGEPWKVGDEVGLHGAIWTERNNATVYAIITEIVMFDIEKGVPVPRNYMGRKSEKRESMLSTMSEMQVGDSFRVEYKLPSMRNFIRNCGIEGKFRAAQESEAQIRVWRVA